VTQPPLQSDCRLFDEVVSVIVPAYNAAGTLDNTLRSARAQTYTDLEIVVVDDGSTDSTRQIAHRHASEDLRVRVIECPHRGPSAARNSGISAAAGSLVAPLDADDLWRPTKIERQVAAIRAGGPRVGLVYTWFALIDPAGRILSTGHRPTQSGDVLRACCRRNLVGNGSGALMRKTAVLECGGYDESLDGCEDLKLYTAIAERYHFAVVPEHLTGYRQGDHNLTSNIEMIRRTAEVVQTELALRHPQFHAELHAMRCDLYHWLLRRGVAAGRLTDTLRVAAALCRLDFGFASRSLLSLPLDILGNRHAAHDLSHSADRGAGMPPAPYFLTDEARG
jgi:glycosyltransferase involved in cell wall biosynthesis